MTDQLAQTRGPCCPPPDRLDDAITLELVVRLVNMLPKNGSCIELTYRASGQSRLLARAAEIVESENKKRPWGTRGGHGTGESLRSRGVTNTPFPYAAEKRHWTYALVFRCFSHFPDTGYPSFRFRSLIAASLRRRDVMVASSTHKCTVPCRDVPRVV